MTHIQYMMMMMDVQADYRYIKKKSQETTNTSVHTRPWANIDPRPIPCHHRRLNLEPTSAQLSRARRQWNKQASTRMSGTHQTTVDSVLGQRWWPNTNPRAPRCVALAGHILPPWYILKCFKMSIDNISGGGACSRHVGFEGSGANH